MKIKQIQRRVKRGGRSRSSNHGLIRHESRSHMRAVSLIVIALGLLSTTILLTGCPTLPPTAITIGLSLIAEGLTSPVGMAVPQDGSGRIFIVDQIGQIRIIDSSGTLLPEPFLDVSDRLVDLGFDGPGTFDERGLLSLAFHPDFVNNGRFFIFYTVPLNEGDPEGFDSRSRISEFLVSQSDPNMADFESEMILLEILEPQFNHDGGQLAFGPDGYLYISIGDGGNANDIGLGHTPDLGNGQDPSNPLGTILRYNADTPGDLIVPDSNPFVDNPNILDEIYAYGLRNPWRFSFDTGGERRLFCSDAGQDLYEEVDIIVAGGNYGWNIKEGLKCFDPDNPTNPPTQCPSIDANGEPLIGPIIEYNHFNENGEVVHTVAIGGFVYRGNEIPELVGHYVFGDWSSDFNSPDGSIFIAEENQTGTWQFAEAILEGEDIDERLNRFVLGFGQDADGEVYVLTSTTNNPTGNTGQVFKIVPARLEMIEIDVENFRFDADDNNGTQVDTVTINVGDTVRWIWRAGSHTVTSGESSSASDAGNLFDASMNSGNQSFSFTFTEAGTVPYFCRPHELLNMKGIIIV
ncbi:MAG: PQQ-dependent sugar dehydrogenase, partial [Deltaproteobacteria bacterium]|nr:PQQ-dependent sugar dehydrogenase [Deltaproteobacteria bacterium]